ncbi:MAG: transporter substrate-binding domain-containing protein [Desulfobacterales bacterium]|nr:transporter substrate-binding domain-containing protein [Desulfobacterales bacterium]
MKIYGILMALAVLVLLPFNTGRGEVVTMAIGEWPPYTSKTDADGKIAEVLVREIFKKAGVEVVFKYYPWKRSFELVKSGVHAASFPWVQNDERKPLFIFPKKALYMQKRVFFHLKDLDFKWETDEDLKQYRIGGVLGYSHVKLLEDKGLTLDVVASDELNFKKMLARRIDIFPSSFIVGYALIGKLFEPSKAILFTNSPKTLTQDDLFLMISKNIPNGRELADQFDKGITELKASGEYEGIFNRFFGIE